MLSATSLHRRARIRLRRRLPCQFQDCRQCHCPSFGDRTFITVAESSTHILKVSVDDEGLEGGLDRCGDILEKSFHGAAQSGSAQSTPFGCVGTPKNAEAPSEAAAIIELVLRAQEIQFSALPPPPPPSASRATRSIPRFPTAQAGIRTARCLRKCACGVTFEMLSRSAERCIHERPLPVAEPDRPAEPSPRIFDLPMPIEMPDVARFKIDARVWTH